MKPRTACLFYEHCSCNVPVSFCSICEGAPACDDHAFVDMVRELQPVLVGKSLSASQMGQFGVLYIFNMPRSRTRHRVVENCWKNSWVKFGAVSTRSCHASLLVNCMVGQEVSSSSRHGAMILEVDLHTIKLWTAVSFVVGRDISIKVDSVDLVIITA